MLWQCGLVINWVGFCASCMSFVRRCCQCCGFGLMDALVGKLSHFTSIHRTPEKPETFVVIRSNQRWPWSRNWMLMLGHSGDLESFVESPIQSLFWSLNILAHHETSLRRPIIICSELFSVIWEKKRATKVYCGGLLTKSLKACATFMAELDNNERSVKGDRWW